MPAYDYYCQLYKTSNVVGTIDSVDSSQLQWSCFVKQDPDRVVMMDFHVTGTDAAGFAAIEDEFKAALASELGLSTGQIEVSTTPFRRMLVGGEDFVFIYTRIRATEDDMDSINEVAQNPSDLSDALARDLEAVQVELISTSVQSFTAPEDATTETTTDVDEASTVSTTAFLLTVGGLSILLLTLGASILIWHCTGSNTVVEDTHLKRLPTTRGTTDDVEMATKISKIEDVASNSSCGSPLGEGVNTHLETAWKQPISDI